MKVDEFLSNRDPGDETDHVEKTDPDFLHVTSLTPSGIEVLYSWSPKRLYRVRDINIADSQKTPLTEWREVPSVTNVLGILDKSGALTWWGMKIGVEGVLALAGSGILRSDGLDLYSTVGSDRTWATTESVVGLLTENKLTVNHVKDKAADRGVNVHSALEGWAVDQSFRANPDLYEEHERGYIVGLNKFLDDLLEAEGVQAEVMVGSLNHGFAGRYDLRLFLSSPHELVTKTYPKRNDKREVVPAGMYLLDLKTSKGVYSSHALQLAAYELASVECGYGETDYRVVIHVTEDGRYEFVRTHAEPEDFLSVLAAYTTMQGAKSWLR